MGTGLKRRNWAVGELLSRHPLFAGLPATLQAALAAASHILEFEAHDFLYRAGEPVREAHLLIKGTVKRATTLSGDTEKVVELVQSEQLLGLGELFGEPSYAASCAAITHCLVVAIDAKKLRAIVRQDLKLSWRVIQAMAQRQQAIEFDVTGYRYGVTGTQRVLDYLVELSGSAPGLAGETTVTLKASKKIIASRIGMTAESFSRSLRELSDSGVIVVEGRHVHIQNAALMDTRVGNQNQRLSFSRKTKTTGSKARKTLSPGALVNLCGRPRVLSQRMATAWALIGRLISPSKSAVRLRQLKLQFEHTLERLERLELPAEVAARLALVQDLWPAYREALFAAEPAPAAAATVLELSEEILAAIDRMTHAAENDADLPAARYVNIAGRNRMLSQRIGKLFLFREWGVFSQAMQRCMDESLSEFESNLAQLKTSGMSVPELSAQLDEVGALWRKFASVLQPDLPQASKERHAQAVLVEGERLLRHVDTAVKLYERLAH